MSKRDIDLDSILVFYESEGEELFDVEDGNDIIMLWNTGESLCGKIEIEINPHSMKTQIIRVTK